MADTKQATPELGTCDRGESNRPHSFIGEGAGKCVNWKPLASRSGPDRTPDTVEYWKSRATTAELKVLTFHEEIAKLPSGPDRGQQDAPGSYRAVDCEKCGRMRVELDGICEKCRWDNDGHNWASVTLAKAAREGQAPTLGFVEWHAKQSNAWPTPSPMQICAVIHWAERYGAYRANCAWEGQASKGDRIKVEREPGCKCEYAIWTNAKGCPLHDVSDPVQAQKE